MNKKILLIGMLDSIHYANWLERICDTNLELHLYPSRNYRKLHPKIRTIIRQNKGKIYLHNLIPFERISPYLEYFLDIPIMARLGLGGRKYRLLRLLSKIEFDWVHALEIQNAGYLLYEATKKAKKSEKIIMTNWGSDIYFYSKFPEHNEKIRQALKITNFYSAECKRDYKLAKALGYTGEFLPLVPNSTTFTPKFFEEKVTGPDQRNQVILKCYGEEFGLGEILLELVEKQIKKNPKLRFFAYSITPDLENRAKNIQKKYPINFYYVTVRYPIRHNLMLEEFRKSRIYIGASKSDGVSTSFLEALATGAFPIQTSTSCAQEWVNDGAAGIITNPDLKSIENAFEASINNISMLTCAQKVNLKIASKRLSFPVISELTRTFYK